MRLKTRQLLSYVLLATYASIAILGDGLHELLPEAGHHHHVGLLIVECDEDDSAPNDHYADASPTPAITAHKAHKAHDAHVCEICAFLFQAIGRPVQLAAPVESQPLVVAATPEPQPIYSPTSVGPHAPRGPPLVS